jgi:hypothetical protein
MVVTALQNASRIFQILEIVKPIRYSFQEMLIYDPTCCDLTTILVNYSDSGGVCKTFCLWRCDPTRVMAFYFLRFLDHTKRRTTVGRTPLDE